MKKNVYGMLALTLVGGAMTVVAFQSFLAKNGEVSARTESSSETAALRERIAQLDPTDPHRGKPDLERFRDDAEHLLEDLDRLDQAAEAWGRDVVSLGTSDDGKLLAAKLSYAEAVNELLQRERLGPTERARAKNTVERLLRPIVERLESEDYIQPEADRRAELDQLAEQVTAELAAYADDTAAAESLVAAARADGLTPGSTLDEVLAGLRAEEAVRAAEEAKAEREKREAAELAQKKRREFDEMVWTLEEVPPGDDEVRRWWVFTLHDWVLPEDPARRTEQSQWDNYWMKASEPKRKDHFIRVGFHHAYAASGEIIRRARARKMSTEDYNEWLYKDWLKHERWALEQGLFKPK